MKRQKKGAKNQSLLDGARSETQQREKPYVIAIRAFFIALLFFMFLLSCLYIFSGKTFLSNGGKIYKGTIDASKFYKTHHCSLVVAKSLDSLGEVEVGDEIFYNTPNGCGSAILQTKGDDVVVLLEESGKELMLNKSAVIGKVMKKIDALGLFLGFWLSDVGAIFFMVVLLSYVTYLTLSRINYENTEYGRQLYKRYRKQQRDTKERARIMKLMENTEDIEDKIVEMLSSSFEDNKEKFDCFSLPKTNIVGGKYKYILFSLHEALVVKDYLSKDERRMISALLELLSRAGEIDQDIEYQLVDLMLKAELYALDEQQLERSITEVLSRDLKEEEMINLGSILYVLVMKNNDIEAKVLKQILREFNHKAQSMSLETQKMAKNISNSLVKLIK